MSFPWCKWRIDWTLGSPIVCNVQDVVTNVLFIGNIQISTLKKNDNLEVFTH
jgi:hypothetical protein